MKTSIVKDFEELKTKWLSLTTIIRRLDNKLLSKNSSKTKDPIFVLRNLESELDKLKKGANKRSDNIVSDNVFQHADKISNQKRTIIGLNTKIESLQKQISKLDRRNSQLYQKCRN